MLERKQRVFSFLVAPCVECVYAYVNVLVFLYGRGYLSVWLVYYQYLC